jgi:hypothetical protein
MASEWKDRFVEAPMPYQVWMAFPPDAIVQVKNIFGESNIGPAKDFWWGFERDNPCGVIRHARRLDRPKA